MKPLLNEINYQIGHPNSAKLLFFSHSDEDASAGGPVVDGVCIG